MKINLNKQFNQKNNCIKMFSVCTGVGGFELGLDKRKFECVGFSEIDEHCNSVLRYRFPRIRNYGDVKEIDHKDLPGFDLLVGGFPCQNISTQGDMEGMVDGKKSSLIFDIIELIQSKMPKYFLLENVSALLSKKFEKDFLHVQERLRKTGYSISYRTFDSSEFGTTQQRKRVFILGARKGTEDGRNSKIYDLEKYFQTKSEEEGGENKVLDGVKIISLSKSTREKHTDYRIRQDGLTGTLTGGMGCNGFSTCNYVIDSGELRFLTPEECEQLMTWESGWTRFGRSKDGDIYKMPIGQRYKQIGNGVVSSVSRNILNWLWEKNNE